jgi:hypothetical protein
MHIGEATNANFLVFSLTCNITEILLKEASNTIKERRKPMM